MTKNNRFDDYKRTKRFIYKKNNSIATQQNKVSKIRLCVERQKRVSFIQKKQQLLIQSFDECMNDYELYEIAA